MSCMKRSVCTEPSVEIVNPGDEVSSRCTVKVIGSFSNVTARQRDRQKSNRFVKQNNSFLRASRSFVHFFAVTARLRRENA